MRCPNCGYENEMSSQFCGNCGAPLPPPFDALDLGGYLSFSGIVTFKNATQIQEVASWVPSDRYLVETDCPYLAPIPFRGKRNEPSYVRYVARKVAFLRGETLEKVAEDSTQNFFRLFSKAELL